MKEHNFGPHVHIMDHPLVSHKLTIMRDKDTSVKRSACSSPTRQPATCP